MGQVPFLWSAMNKFKLGLSTLILMGGFVPFAHALETQDGDSCAGYVTGAMRITGGPENANISETLICNGIIWEVQSVCTAPSGCTNVGDVCADGSLFAGFVVYSNSTCEPLFVTDNNQSTAIQWKTSTGTNDISTDDHVDGQVNAANRGGVISSFPAFDLCESNSYHGKSDWYLPARAELNLLWLNRQTIDVNAAGNFTVSLYRSSTEYNASYAWYQNFGTGVQTITTKTLNHGVRCVRRD